MEIKQYNSKAEIQAAFRKSIQMRSVWEQSVREKWTKEQAESNGLKTVSTVAQ